MPEMEDRSGSVSDKSPLHYSPTKANGELSNVDHLKQKRARSQLSCKACRSGKLKCNRQHEPACDQCVKRNRESACVYLPPPAKTKSPQNVKGRIRQLENLVVDLMNQNRDAPQRHGSVSKSSSTQQSRGSVSSQSAEPFSQPTPSSDNDLSSTTRVVSRRTGDGMFDDVDPASTPFGQMKISKDGDSYVGESHWGAILDSISDLKREVSNEQEEENGWHHSVPDDSPLYTWHNVPLGQAQANAPNGLGFMLGGAEHITKDQLIAGVPEKKVADRLLSLWFNSPDPFKPLIHAPTFQDEYRRFWRSPPDTPAMWLGLLFSIMSLAASFGLRDLDPNSQQAQKILQDTNKYHKLAASAALLGDFTKPKQYTIECLILYAAGLRSNNAFVNVWLMTGLLIRLALRMGYHRDPSHYPAISVFPGEMRRRVWAIINMIDVLVSFQLGLPSMVKTIHSDTQPPRNLLDRDFNVNTQELPPSRGIDELTPCSYIRAKLRITRIFADASELSHATVEPSRGEVSRLDRQLEQAKEAIPPLLKMPELNDLVTDPAEQLMCRFNLDLLHLKSKTVLHRRYMLTPLSQLTPDEQAGGIGYSHLACVNSARQVLQHHHTIYTASQTGGQLESVKWYMGSISTHDFLLAAMIICLELSTQMNSTGLYRCPQRDALMDALEKSQRIWSDQSGRKRDQVRSFGKGDGRAGEQMFDETEKAGRAMGVMLEKVRRKLAEGSQRRDEGSGAVGVVAQDGEAGQDGDLGQEAGNVGHAGGQEAPMPMTGLMREPAFPQNMEELRTQQERRQPFNGVVSTYQWDSVPDDIETGYAPDSAHRPLGSFDYSMSSQSQATDPSPSSDVQSNGTMPAGMGQPNYGMIGDMLDSTSTNAYNNLDWAMWDSSIKNGGTPYDLNFNEMEDLSNPNANVNPPMPMMAGNALVGGSGPGSAYMQSLQRMAQTDGMGNGQGGGRAVPAPYYDFTGDCYGLGSVDRSVLPQGGDGNMGALMAGVGGGGVGRQQQVPVQQTM